VNDLCHKVVYRFALILSFFCPLFSTLFVISAHAGLTCSGVTNIVGVEYIAECATSEPPYRYVQTDIRCEGGLVVKGATQQWMNGGTRMTTAYVQSAIVNSAAFASSKVFGNSAKTHFVSVTNTFAKYNGVLGGIALKPLAAAPTIHIDVLSGICVIPRDLVDLDIDNDGFIVCDDCDDENAAVNPSEAELCSDGIDNNCDNLIDCDDTDCAGSSDCISPPKTDVLSENFSRDCNTNQ